MSRLFCDLSPPLHDSVLTTITDTLGFTTMTPVQSAAIPLFRQNKDVAVEAITGSGKTLAFLIPILERLIRRETPLGSSKKVGALIVAPTRELAEQIFGVLNLFIDRLQPKLSSLLLVGGVRSVAEDLGEWEKQGGNVVVGTPGRLLDILQRRVFDLKGERGKLSFWLSFFFIFVRV
jgi:ATP-dependent RNA helicase DDX55/SPB4